MPSLLSAPAKPSVPLQPKIWRAGTLTYTTTGLMVLFCWLLWGDFAWSVRDRSVGQIVQLLLHKFHSSDTLMTVLMGTLPAVLTMILAPIISYKSDRHRGRWGRRIPFLIIPTPFIVLGMVGLAFSSQIGTFLHQAVGPRSFSTDFSILLSIGLSWTLFEVACITANSVFGALINDVVPREVLGRFYGAWRALSLVAGMIFFHWGFGKAEAHYAWIFLGIAALYGGGFTLMCLKVKEGDYTTPVPMDAGRDTKGFLHAAKTYFQECFGIPYYWLYFITIALSYQNSLPIGLFSVFYGKSLHMDDTAYGNCLAITFACSLVLSYPLGILVDRFHPLRVGICVQFLYALVTLGGALFIHDAWTFGIAFIANGVLNGTWYTTVASLPQRMLPKAEFAQFTSANALVGGVVVMVLSPLIGLFLDHVGHHYRYTFLLSFLFTMVSITLGLILHRKFMTLGGPKNYVAPEGLNKRNAMPGSQAQ